VHNSNTKKCLHCSNAFNPHVASQIYCTRNCQRAYNRTPQKQNKYKRICKGCGKEFNGRKDSRHCGKSCSSKSVWQPRRTFEVVLKECIECGDEFRVKPSHFDRRKYCSRKCMGEYKTKHYSGKNSAHWKGGGSYYYGANWRKQKTTVRKRDGNKCQICGKCGSGVLVDVHHIQPFKTFKGDWVKANDINNLICLCRQCHSDVERRNKPCPKRLL